MTQGSPSFVYYYGECQRCHVQGQVNFSRICPKCEKLVSAGIVSEVMDRRIGGWEVG